MKRLLVLHPFLFALSPILYLYLHNLSQTPISSRELIAPVAVALVTTAVLTLLLSIVLRNRHKAGLIVTLMVVLCFSYGLVFSTNVSEPARYQSRLMVWLLLLFLVATWLIIRIRQNLRFPTVILNTLSVAVVVTNLGAGMPALLNMAARSLTAGTPAHADAIAQRVARRPGTQPDIYYIILDAYGRSDVLKANFSYDNSDFLNYLAQQGFFVVSRGHSNYPATYLSLASSLNFTYLDSVLSQPGAISEGDATLIHMIGYSRVAEFLKRHGYTVVSFSSGYTGTDLDDADVHLSPRWALSEFQYVLLSTTIVPPLLNSLTGWSPKDLHRARIIYALRNLPDAARGRHPAFVFAHVVCPHLPFVFGAQGEPVRTTQYSRMNDEGPLEVVNYRAQITYLTDLVKEMVSRLLAASPTSPVIIIQGDHGPHGGIPRHLAHSRRHASLNAIRLPARPEDDSSSEGPEAWGSGERPGSRNPGTLLYDSMTPVNTFRVVLDRYFDTTLALLSDKSYFNPTGEPYHFSEQR
jgi:hypothetical protein